MSTNAISETELDALIEVLAMVDIVAKHHQSGMDAFLPAELQRRGPLPPSPRRSPKSAPR